MPANHGGRLHDHQRTAPIEQPRQVTGGTHCSISGTGLNDTAYYGTHYSAEIDAATLFIGRTTDPWNNNPPADRGGSILVGLSSYSGGPGDVSAGFNSRFCGMLVTAVVTLA